jgi:hypothetical protein
MGSIVTTMGKLICSCFLYLKYVPFAQYILSSP